MTVTSCECGAEFDYPHRLRKHLSSCLGPDPTINDLYRVGKVVDTADGCKLWSVTRLPPIAAAQLEETVPQRAALKLAAREVPADTVVARLCKSSACVNPEHLEVRPRGYLRGSTPGNPTVTCPQGCGWSGQSNHLPAHHRNCLVPWTMARYLELVNPGGTLGDDECWHTKVTFGPQRAYRVGLEIKLGRKLKRNEFACHTCDRNPCANPGHVFLGDAKTNHADMESKGRAAGQRYWSVEERKARGAIWGENAWRARARNRAVQST